MATLATSAVGLEVMPTIGECRRETFRRSIGQCNSTDVYQDSWPWVDFLTSAIQHATCSTQPCVITQAAKEYKGGIYRQLRRDLNCKEGLFLPSRIPYLKYGLVRAQGSGTKTPGARSPSCLDASSSKTGVTSVCARRTQQVIRDECVMGTRMIPG